MTLVYLVASLLSYLRTEAQQRQIRGAFSQYMSPHYVDELAAHPERLKLNNARLWLKPTRPTCSLTNFVTRCRDEEKTMARQQKVALECQQ